MLYNLPMTTTKNTDDNLVVTLTRSDEDACAFARFTWSADMSDCDVVAVGVEDDELDAMLAAKAHEGADFPGFDVEVA